MRTTIDVNGRRSGSSPSPRDIDGLSRVLSVSRLSSLDTRDIERCLRVLGVDDVGLDGDGGELEHAGICQLYPRDDGLCLLVYVRSP